MPRATLPRALSVRAQQWAAQLLGALPPSVQVRLSGKPPVQIDGETLAPEVQLVLAVLALQREPPLETLSVADARAAVAAGVKFPPGNYVVWSGQFEYLERATARLKIVVPSG